MFLFLSDPVGQTNYQVVLAITYLLTVIGKASDVKATLTASFERSIHRDWSNCLDRRQVWNQKRPPWFEALHHFIYPLLTPIANILISSMQTGATIYQVIRLIQCHFQAILNTFSHIWLDYGPSDFMPDRNT